MLLRCYQCDNVAQLCTKPDNRLYCTVEHHDLYTEGWKRLLARPAFRNRAFHHLGMKRAEPDEDEEELTIDRIELLPDEILAEILLFAYPEFEEHGRLLREVFIIRETSNKVKRVVDTFLIGRVTELVFESELGCIDDTRLALFTSLKRLACHIDYTNFTDVGLLAVSNHLEYLSLCNSNISNETLGSLTNLRHLLLMAGEGEERNICLSTLTLLEKLELENEDSDDAFLASLPNLRHLTVGEDSTICGHHFRFLIQLETLCLVGNTTIKDDALVSLSPSLRKLMIYCPYNMTALTDRGLSQMTGLEELTLYDNPIITDEGILPLCNIKILEVGPGSRITDRGISKMAGLKSIVCIYQDISLEQLFCFSKTLEAFTVQDLAWINWDTLAHFPLLKHLYWGYRVSYVERQDAKIRAIIDRLRKERGIEINL